MFEKLLEATIGAERKINEKGKGDIFKPAAKDDPRVLKAKEYEEEKFKYSIEKAVEYETSGKKFLLLTIGDNDAGFTDYYLIARTDEGYDIYNYETSQKYHSGPSAVDLVVDLKDEILRVGADEGLYVGDPEITDTVPEEFEDQLDDEKIKAKEEKSKQYDKTNKVFNKVTNKIEKVTDAFDKKYGIEIIDQFFGRVGLKLPKEAVKYAKEIVAALEKMKLGEIRYDARTREVYIEDFVKTKAAHDATWR